MPIAELLCQGARSDVVALAEHLLIDGTPEENRPLTEAISALEGILSEYSDNHVIATIVALAHLDIAWAWRGTESIRTPPHATSKRSTCTANARSKCLIPFAE